MSLLFIAPGRDMSPWKEALLSEDSNLDIEIWPEVTSKERVQFAVCWNQPSHTLDQYPNLKAVSSLGAGADHILEDETLPKHVIISRVVSPTLVHQMKEYVLLSVLSYQRDLPEYFRQKQMGEWNPLPCKAPEDIPVGIMGLGSLGWPVCLHLADHGYRVNGWSRSPKVIPGVQTFSGRSEIGDFLHHTQVLVCMLPLTNETEGILNLDVFREMRRPGYLVNVARGEHLVEEDLIYALDKGWLEGACLDVFTEEPLPEHHAFRNRKNILITPHIASLTPPEEAARQLVENYKRALSGMDLKNEIDRSKGY